MNIFNKIIDSFNRQKVIDELFDDIKNLDEVLLDKRLTILKKLLRLNLTKLD